MTWARKFDYIKARTFDEVLELWAKRSPTGIELGQHTLSNHLTETFDYKKLPTDGQTYVGPIESRQLLSELYFGVAKAHNVNFNAQHWALNGAYSNGSLHSFCSIIQLMQAIIALFGIFIIRVSGKYYVVDAFPWLGYAKEDRALQKTFGDQWWQSGRIISDKKDLIDQSEIAELFQRCLRVVTVSDWNETIVEQLIDCDGSWFNRPRNNVMYNFTGWIENADLMTPSAGDIRAAVRNSARSIFDLELLTGFGPLPQSLLLSSLLGKIWSRFAATVILQLDGKNALWFPTVGDNTLVAEFEKALNSALVS